MSDGDDFLARWSRRKRAARSSEAQSSEAQSSDAEARATEPRPDPAAPAAADPPEPLPSLDDLTAESDLVAFLRAGVPAALKNAAMRKMWSLDPVVRDYIGPSEYAWDFNKPGSMPGFGALVPGSSVADFLSTVSRVLPDESKATAPEPAASPPGQVTADASGETGSVASAEPEIEADPPQVASTAETAEETAPREPPRASPKPRHGGALPR